MRHPASACSIRKILLFSCIFLVLCTAFFSARAVLLLPAHLSETFNEGWNAFFATRALNPTLGPLYPPADTLIFNNYPPLSFYILGAIGKLTGNLIVAGRSIALLALLSCAGLIYRISRQLGAEAMAACLAATLFLGFSTLLAPEYVAMNDPQWLAHAVMLSGLCLLLPPTPNAAEATIPPVRIVAASLIFVIGGLIKHNILALPLAVTLWLLVQDRRAFLIWCASGIGWASLACLGTWSVFGKIAFLDIFAHKRMFLARLMLEGLSTTATLLGMVVSAVVIWRARHEAQGSGYRLIALFGGIALVPSILERAGIGVARNASFEAIIALSIATALAVSRAIAHAAASDAMPRPRGWMRSGAVLLTGLAILPFLARMPEAMIRAEHGIATAQADKAAGEQAVSYVAGLHGPVLCQMPAVCYWAGKRFEIDFFNYDQAVLTGTPIDPVKQQIEANRFDAILLIDHVQQRRKKLLATPRPLEDLALAAYPGRVEMKQADLLVLLPHQP